MMVVVVLSRCCYTKVGPGSRVSVALVVSGAGCGSVWW